ncbi:MAG: TauD/TfdA family dioxygenase [Alphaproteobacteria bacterium]|nr:TauD/TfdA family dioxygenase [Alphaproteobacteria bacterium]
MPTPTLENPNDPYVAARAPAIPFEAITDPAAWTAEELSATTTWRHDFTDAEINDLRTAVSSLTEDNVDLMPLGKDAFPLPHLSKVLREIRNDLIYGRGFIHFRGLPVDDFGKRGAAAAFWAISQHLGDGVLSQNKHGHVLGHVTDLGESKSNPSQRGPYSREEIPFHVDCGDVVGLLCLETPISGGESCLASSVSVHNELLKRRPDLVHVLAEPYARDRRDEIPPNMAPWYKIPVFNYHQGYFSASIEPTYIGSAHRFDDIPEMTAAQQEAIRVVQALSREMRFDMGFRRGDMQFLNNHVVFHTRLGYQDRDEPDRKRHLVRIWLKALDGRPLPNAFYERHGPRDKIDRPGGIIGPDTVLNAPIDRI